MLRGLWCFQKAVKWVGLGLGFGVPKGSVAEKVLISTVPYYRMTTCPHSKHSWRVLPISFFASGLACGLLMMCGNTQLWLALWVLFPALQRNPARKHVRSGPASRFKPHDDDVWFPCPHSPAHMISCSFFTLASAPTSGKMPTHLCTPDHT